MRKIITMLRMIKALEELIAEKVSRNLCALDTMGAFCDARIALIEAYPEVFTNKIAIAIDEIHAKMVHARFAEELKQEMAEIKQISAEMKKAQAAQSSNGLS